MPKCSDATELLAAIFRYGTENYNCKLVIDSVAFDRIKGLGLCVFHADTKLLEWAHPMGTVWICPGKATELPQGIGQFEWMTDEIVPYEDVLTEGTINWGDPANQPILRIIETGNAG